jgi:hypothetical protein
VIGRGVDYPGSDDVINLTERYSQFFKSFTKRFSKFLLIKPAILYHTLIPPRSNVVP